MLRDLGWGFILEFPPPLLPRSCLLLFALRDPVLSSQDVIFSPDGRAGRAGIMDKQWGRIDSCRGPSVHGGLLCRRRVTITDPCFLPRSEESADGFRVSVALITDGTRHPLPAPSSGATVHRGAAGNGRLPHFFKILFSSPRPTQPAPADWYLPPLDLSQRTPCRYSGGSGAP